MCAQAIAHKKRLARREAERKRREKALQLWRDGISVIKVTQNTGVSTSTVYRLKRSAESVNQEQLQKLLDTKNSHPGRQPVLSHP